MRFSLVAPSLALLLTAGCGGGSKGRTFDQLYGDYLNMLCKLEATCGDVPDEATCLASQDRASTDLLTLKADVAAGKVRVDAAKDDVCAGHYQRYGAAACTQSAIAAVNADTAGSDACVEVLVGTVADGGTCFDSIECVSRKCVPADETCVPAIQCCTGTCVAKPTPIPVGADCTASLPEQNCGGGAVCLTTGSSTSATCILPSKIAGTVCTTQYECAMPLFCDVDATTSTGTCQPAVATGQPCNPDVGFRACEDLHDYCSWSTETCTPRGAVGAACSETQPLNCLGYAQCIGSTCVAVSPVGGACNPTDGPGCLGSLQCVGNTCAFLPAAGACR
jgi:hypothetical protein